MNEQHACQRCGRELAADAPEGICPSCLMEANLSTGPGTLATVAGGRREPVSVAEVARLFPEMEILGLIGVGGMGAVYKAHQPKLDRFVALKILHADARDPSFVERFTREARTLARLSHPNIVAVYDFGQRSRRREEADVAEGPPPHVGGYEDDGGDLFFLIMELVDGVTLRDLLRGERPGIAELDSEGGKPSATRRSRIQPEQALAIVPPICEALQYAHEKGVVHRDIKPENILLDKDGRVKVADFGIARLAGLERPENLTGEGQVIGTAHYMAPEQVERPASVDHRADIYALGVVFYEMLTGELPLGRFPHPSKKVQIDVRLDEVVLKALEKEPERRYQQASEMRTGVETVHGSPKGRKDSLATTRGAATAWLFRPLDRIRGARALGAGLAILACTVLGGWFFGIHTDGVLDLHAGPGLPLWTFAGQALINWFCMVVVLLPAGYWLSKSPVRLVDLMGGQAIARWPVLVAILLMGASGYRAIVEPLIDRLLLGIGSGGDILLVMTLSLLPLGAIVWMVWLMYHGYASAFSLRGKRAGWSFAAALIVAEILSKWAVVVMLEDFL